MADPRFFGGREGEGMPLQTEMFRLKSLGKRGDVWRARASYDMPTGQRDETGQPLTERKEKNRSFKANGKREAQAIAAAWVAELNENARREASGPARTVGEYLDTYIDGKEGRIERSTVRRYRERAKYVKDGHKDARGLGGVLLEDLTADMVRAWHKGIHDAGLGVATANDALVLLRSAMKDAALNQRIAFSPVELVKKLKPPKGEPNALDARERERLLADLEADGTRPNASPAQRLGVLMALFTGMREGEICALRWQSVDFRAKVIKVREALGREGDAAYLKEPKNGGSRRDVPMPQTLADELRAHRARMQERCIANGVPFRESLFVLGDIDGAFMHPKYLYRAWLRRRDRLELVGTQGTPPTFHDLRHTFATAAVAGGMDIKSISSIMGHADASMTLNIYASADADAKRRTMDAVEQALLTPAPKCEVIEFRRAAGE